MNPSKIPAPGAYEVVVVIAHSKNGKGRRGSKGEQMDTELKAYNHRFTARSPRSTRR